MGDAIFADLDPVAIGSDSFPIPAPFPIRPESGWRAYLRAVRQWMRNDHDSARTELLWLIQSVDASSALRLVAWRLLLLIDPERTEFAAARQVLGATWEMNNGTGTELIAVYRDGLVLRTHAHEQIHGSFTPRPDIATAAQGWLNTASSLVELAARSKDPRTGRTPAGDVRLTLLTPAGSHVIAGTMEAIENDTTTSAVSAAARDLRCLLTAEAGEGEQAESRDE